MYFNMKPTKPLSESVLLILFSWHPLQSVMYLLDTRGQQAVGEKCL